MNPRLPLSLLVLAVAGAAAASLPACGPSANAQSSQPPPPQTVSLAVAKRKTIETTFTLDGNVTPSLQSTLSAQQSGNVVAVYVNEGDRVHAGELLAKIDDAPLQAQLVQKLGTARSTSAKLSQSSLQNPVTSQTAVSGLVQSQESLSQARNALTAADANVASTKISFTADRSLMQQGYVSSQQFEQARQQYVAALSAQRNAHDSVTQAKATLDTARRNLDTVPIQRQDIASNEGLVEEARGEVQQLQTQIAETSIVAPYDGTIVSRTIDPGGYASPNAPVFSIAKVDRVYVNFNVPDEDLDDVRVGTHVQFITASRSEHHYAGRVVEVNAVPTGGTLTYRARLVVDNPDLRLRGGELVAVTATRAKARDVVTVPRTAVLANGPSADVFIAVSPPPATPAPDGAPATPAATPAPSGAPVFETFVAHRVPVRTGLETDTEVAVMSPRLREGTRVLAARSDTVHDGSLVRVARATSHRAAGAAH